MEQRLIERPPTSANARIGGVAVAAVIALAVVFTFGVAIGYNSVYRNVAVAMTTPPTAGQL
jgi:predicted permease